MKIEPITVKECEELVKSDCKEYLLYRGRCVAKKTLDWGWTTYYKAAPGRGGFGTVRNTGFFHYDSIRDFKKSL